MKCEANAKRDEFQNKHINLRFRRDVFTAAGPEMNTFDDWLESLGSRGGCLSANVFRLTGLNSSNQAVGICLMLTALNDTHVGFRHVGERLELELVSRAVDSGEVELKLLKLLLFSNLDPRNQIPIILPTSRTLDGRIHSSGHTSPLTIINNFSLSGSGSMRAFYRSIILPKNSNFSPFSSLSLSPDNVASLAMGKSGRRSIHDDPSSPSSSPYIFYHSSTSRPDAYQLWSPNDFVTTQEASALRFV